jgi:hypothetical protein
VNYQQLFTRAGSYIPWKDNFCLRYKKAAYIASRQQIQRGVLVVSLEAATCLMRFIAYGW